MRAGQEAVGRGDSRQDKAVRRSQLQDPSKIYPAASVNDEDGPGKSIGLTQATKHEHISQATRALASFSSILSTFADSSENSYSKNVPSHIPLDSFSILSLTPKRRIA